MDISGKDALDFVIQAYVAAAAEREDLELLHLLSTSPDSRPPSSDEFSDDDLETFGKPVERQASAAAPEPAASDDAAKKTPQKDSKIVFSADKPSEAFVFAREEVPQRDPEAEAPTSALSAMLGSGGSSSGNTGKELQIRVFGDPIPGDPLDLNVPERATMAQVITLVLNEYMRLNNMEMLFLEGVDFELLMAEDDGFTEDDMPKLGRTNIIGDVAWEFFSLRKHDKPQVRCRAARLALSNRPEPSPSTPLRPPPSPCWISRSSAGPLARLARRRTCRRRAGRRRRSRRRCSASSSRRRRTAKRGRTARS
tara:strand:+ start:2831 stop:3760 length:930 start_codon:yes stop_codon:yes gene_type:complete